MRILLDNCVPRAFERSLAAFVTIHCSRLGWERLANGKLLSAAEAEGFPVMVTVDRSMRFEQNMSGRQLSVLVLHVPKNDLKTLNEMVDEIQRQIPLLQPGTVVILAHPSMA